MVFASPVGSTASRSNSNKLQKNTQQIAFQGVKTTIKWVKTGLKRLDLPRELPGCSTPRSYHTKIERNAHKLREVRPTYPRHSRESGNPGLLRCLAWNLFPCVPQPDHNSDHHKNSVKIWVKTRHMPPTLIFRHF